MTLSQSAQGRAASAKILFMEQQLCSDELWGWGGGVEYLAETTGPGEGRKETIGLRCITWSFK